LLIYVFYDMIRYKKGENREKKNMVGLYNYVCVYVFRNHYGKNI